MMRNDYGYMNRGRIDMRNPYGSRGGYVDSRRDYEDYRQNYGQDYRRDYNDYNEYQDYRSDYRGYDREYDRNYDRGYDRSYGTETYTGYYGATPFEMMRTRGGFGDYHSKKLEGRELHEWKEMLMQEIDPKYKEMFREDKIMQKAQQLGIKMNEFTPEELSVTTLMMWTDYQKDIGIMNPDIYMKMARSWLEDPDAEIKGGEKLSAYYNHIIMPKREDNRRY